MSVVYLNGAFVPAEEAKVSVNDRGFLFGDGVYEVSPAYSGFFLGLDNHLARLRNGLAALRIGFDPASLAGIHDELIQHNGLEDKDISYVYVQITRGVAPRTHAFPTVPVQPTVYAFASPYTRPERAVWERGFDAVTVPDRRWSQLNVKSIALLPNVLAQQAAVDAGVKDAIFVRDGVAIEGAHSNFFGVFDGTVVTYPQTNLILGGITREFVIDLVQELGIPLELRAIPVEDLQHADELFFTGTTTEVRPCVRVDGKAIGDGSAGPVTRTLFDAFLDKVGRLTAAAAARA